MLRRLFGDDVAEHDANLSEYFIETPAYRMALSGEKRFIIGRKGAGKSAICQQLQKKLPLSGALCVSLAPQRIQFTALKFGLRDFAQWGPEPDLLLQRIWYYGLLCETALALVRQCKKTHDSDFATLANFIEKHYNHTEPSAFARLLNTAMLFLEQLELGIGPLSLRRPRRHIDPIAMETALDNLRLPIASFVARNLSRGVYILVDNLDEGWDNSPEANAFVRGLLLAVHEICQPNLPVRLIVFLRSDMYDAVTRQFQHVDKYRQYQELISWGPKDIMALVAERIRVNLKVRHPSASVADIWERAFAAPGGNNTRAPNYIIDRSLLRPREVLQFCRLAAEKADQRGHSQVHWEDLQDAETEYSRWKIDDLSTEFLFALPGLKENVLGRFLGGPARFTPAQLRLLLEDALTDPRRVGRSEWLENLHHADALIQTLYDIGFLKCASQNKQWQSAQHPDFDLSRAEAFLIHPAFRSYLRVG